MSEPELLAILKAFHRARILVLGDVMLDRFIYGSIERISPEAPVPVMSVERVEERPGGAANVARNIAALGGSVRLMGVVGADRTARALRELLHVMPSVRPTLLVDTSRVTTVKTRHLADRQQVLRTDRESRAPLDAPSSDALLAELREAIDQSDVVILSDYDKGVLCERVVGAAIAGARAAGRPVLVDPKSRSFSRYAGATLLTPNLSELQAACGLPCDTDEQIVTAARGLLDQGLCEVLVVTRGPQGMSVIPRVGEPAHIRTAAREVYDVSGAGDTAIAALAMGLAAGGPISPVARLANLAAGIVVGKAGTATVCPGEIIARLEELHVPPSGKHYTLENARAIVAHWRSLGLRIGFTNGCFDLLHPGHLWLLQQARQAADRLVVGLNSDLSVQRLKGPGRPVQGEAARALVLAALKSVDAVVIFEEDTPLSLIRALEPDVLVKGADYELAGVVGADLVLARGGRVLLAQLLPEHSTTHTIRRMASGAPP